MTFPCTQCGACCTQLNLGNRAELRELPTKSDGSCIHLAGRLCTIYEDRPLVCRVDELYNRRSNMFFNLGITNKEEYYEKTAEFCNGLQKMLNIDESFRVELKEKVKDERRSEEGTRQAEVEA